MWNDSLVCSTSCETCFGAATHCTSCTGSLPYFYNNYCYSSCNLGFFANSNKTCEGINKRIFWVTELACSTPCETCVGSSTHCTSCVGSIPYLFNNYCYSACNDGYYASPSNICEGIIL